MKKMLSFWSLLFLSISVYSQYPDNIQIKIKDTFRNIEDCVVNIFLFRSNNDSFSFPKNYYIAEGYENVDLIILLQKWKNNKYTLYQAKESPPRLPLLLDDPLILKKYKKLTVIDSLSDLGSLKRGRYRMRVLYNQRREDGKLDTPHIKAYSNWAKFYVDKDKIIVSRYLLLRLKEAGKLED